MAGLVGLRAAGNAHADKPLASTGYRTHRHHGVLRGGGSPTPHAVISSAASTVRTCVDAFAAHCPIAVNDLLDSAAHAATAGIHSTAGLRVLRRGLDEFS
jgi:hypothetical protein